MLDGVIYSHFSIQNYESGYGEVKFYGDLERTIYTHYAHSESLLRPTKGILILI